MPRPTPSGMEWQTWKNSTLKGPICNGLAGLDGVQFGFAAKAVARQLDFQQAAGQRGGIDGRVHFLEQVVNRADVVFVTVGDDDAAHLVAVLGQIGHIGDDVIDPQHVVFGEHQAGIDDEDFAAVFVHHQIAAHFTQPPQGDDA